MLRLTSAREGLDDEHAPTAAGAWTRQHVWLVGCCTLGRIRLFGAGRHGEQLARLGDVGGAVAVGEQPEVADAVSAKRRSPPSADVREIPMLLG